jgi:hypothetical protein
VGKESSRELRDGLIGGWRLLLVAGVSLTALATDEMKGCESRSRGADHGCGQYLRDSTNS